MHKYVAKIKYADVRVIRIEAESYEKALEKFEAGDWCSEDTVDFYSEEEISSLKLERAGS